MSSLVEDLHRALKVKSFTIQEIGVVVGGDEPSVVVVENNVGITMTALKPIFKYSLQEIYRLKRDNDFMTGLQHILCSEVHAAKLSSLDAVSMAILVVKGDFPLAYSMRKLLIKNGCISTAEELSFTKVLFTRHAKVPSGWEHRRWCLRMHAMGRYQSKPSTDSNRCINTAIEGSNWRNSNITKTTNASSTMGSSTTGSGNSNSSNSNSSSSSSSSNSSLLFRGELETEKELCREMAEKHPKNYYAWVHRLWLLQFMDQDLLGEDMIFIKEWLHHHVSDHSACNHFIQLAVHTMSNYTVLSAYEAAAPISGTYTYPSPSQRMVYLQGLLADSEQLLLERPGHEALWCLRRSLLEMLLRELLAAAESSRLAAGTAAKLLGDYALCAAPLPQSTNSSPVMVCCELQWRSFCPSVFEPASGAVDSAADDVDWEALRLRRICTKNGASDSSIDTASYQPVEPLCWTTFYSTLSSADIGGDYSDVADVTVAQLVAFLRAEVKFCCRCATVRAMWGFEEQRRLALRYVVFALDRAQRLFASHTVRRSCSTSVATVADAFAFGALALRRLVGVKSMSMIAAASSSL